MEQDKETLKDNIRGAIIANSMGQWELNNKIMLDEVDIDDATTDIFNLVEDYIEKLKP